MKYTLIGNFQNLPNFIGHLVRDLQDSPLNGNWWILYRWKALWVYFPGTPTIRLYLSYWVSYVCFSKVGRICPVICSIVTFDRALWSAQDEPCGVLYINRKPQVSSFQKTLRFVNIYCIEGVMTIWVHEGHAVRESDFLRNLNLLSFKHPSSLRLSRAMYSLSSTRIMWPYSMTRSLATPTFEACE